ncbi:glycosyltransferase family 2 protein [Arthrobacter gengyunqii]|uniref:4,4'-diaponeurosporenoate glycosyltransferase n=1 Tax=Arthrobacter gengyunqii TaxID=2886940 RepID=A0A9X1S6F0_9MICC|nr:glycosyltransferase family 2 protein [Arthrobacter gengyunqii]MCC3268274.1 glycosyltransferase family 2 protein [Arthrobacter gengyunqii]UOY95680.1 glycosyltransferase family 2 protein [Arthrobacter gengyunqii]
MTAALPSVSVVIPCLNDAAALDACLFSLAAQSVPPLEIVVVDNNSTDSSAAVARRHGARVVFEAEPGIPAAAAAGYDAAAAEIIARCDADCLLPADWVQRIAESFAADPDLGALSGPGAFYGFPRPVSAALSVLYLGAYYLAMASALAHLPLFGSNLALRRSAWEKVRSEVHRHDPEMHDDVCLSLHLGQRSTCRFDRTLVVGMAPRALIGAANVIRRFRRAFHTLWAHWPGEAPWVRWPRRFAAGDYERREEPPTANTCG